jgi:hypothetical protein
VWGPRSGSGYCGDWDFVRTTLALYPPDSPVTVDKELGVWRPAGG